MSKSKGTSEKNWAKRKLSRKFHQDLCEQRAWGTLRLDHRNLLDRHQAGWYDAWEFADLDSPEARMRREAIIHGVLPRSFEYEINMIETQIDMVKTSVLVRFRPNAHLLPMEYRVCYASLDGTDEEVREALNFAIEELRRARDEHLDPADGWGESVADMHAHDGRVQMQ